MLALHPPGALIDAAACALAQLAARMLQRLPARSSTPSKPAVLGLVGPGHNGEDTLGCLRRLSRNGWLCTSLQGLEPTTLGTLDSHLPDTGLVIDGWLGLGRNRPLSAALSAAIARLSVWRAASPESRQILAVDLPSGLDPDGGVGDPIAVAANTTLALLAPARGLFSPCGRAHAGKVFVAPLVGLRPRQLDHRLIRDPQAFRDLQLAKRPVHVHKGMLGEVVLVGGSKGTDGAIALAAAGALALSPGKVHVVSPSDRLRLPMQVMHRSLEWYQQQSGRTTSSPAIPSRQVIGIGCGLGEDESAQNLLDRALESGQDLVLDADALNLLARNKALLKKRVFRHAQGAKSTIPTPRTVLTPHPLEAARLLDLSRDAVERDRHAAACALARQSEAVVLLKGAGTLIASPEGDCDIVDLAAPALAQAGSGDVLCGVVCALLALHPSLPAHRLAAAAALLHAEAARRWSQRTGQVAGLSMDTLAQEVSGVFAEFDRDD